MLRTVLCLSVALTAALPAMAQDDVDSLAADGSYAVVRAGDRQMDCDQLYLAIQDLNTRASAPGRELDARIEANIERGLPGSGTGRAVGMASAAGLLPGQAGQAAAMASLMGAAAAERESQDALRREAQAMQPLRARARHLWNLGQRKSCSLLIVPEDDYSAPIEEFPE